jgi:ATP-dependent protease HslVU (ClpYQ) peptidase subunit
MTTIVCSKTEMACDLQMTLSGTQKTKCKTKVFQFDPIEDFCPEPFMVGFAGDASEIMDAVDFFTHPEIYKKPPNTKGLVGLTLTKSGKIFQFSHPAKWVRVDAKCAAIGSGAMIALGAMHSGATPKQAIKAASELDPFTGMGIKTFNL